MAITIRTTSEDEIIIDNLKFYINEKASSKALLKAAKLLPQLRDDLYDAQEHARNLREEVEQLKQSIIDYNDSKSRMLYLANKD